VAGVGTAVDDRRPESVIDQESKGVGAGISNEEKEYCPADSSVQPATIDLHASIIDGQDLHIINA
jgi:hypothetical protein